MAFNFALMLAAMLATTVLASAASHTVGGSTGWTIPPNSTVYSDWASAQTFAAGDTLVFNFPTGVHNVMEVPKASYDSCSASKQIGSALSTGPATVTLTPGSHYYICGVTGHCSAGQKLAIVVPAAASAPSPSPATGASSPAPTPASAPPMAAGGPVAPTPVMSGHVAPTPAPSGADVTPTPAVTGDVPSQNGLPGNTGAPTTAPGPSGPGSNTSGALRTAVDAVLLLSVGAAFLL